MQQQDWEQSSRRQDGLKSILHQSLPLDLWLFPSSYDTPGSGSDTDQSLVGKQRCSSGLQLAAGRYFPEALPSSESPGVHSVYQGPVQCPYHQVPAWFGCVLDEELLSSPQAHPTSRVLAWEQWTEAVFWIFSWELVQSPHRPERRNHHWSLTQWRCCWMNHHVQWRWDPVALLWFYCYLSHWHLLVVSERSWSNWWCSSAALGLQKEEEHEWSQQKQEQSALLLSYQGDQRLYKVVVISTRFLTDLLSFLQVSCPASCCFSGNL